MTLSHVFFRADATLDVGSGHVMRCLALAQYISQKGVSCHLLTSAPDGPAVQQWKDSGLFVSDIGPVDVGSAADAQVTMTMAEELSTNGNNAERLLIADSYSFDQNYLTRLHESSFGLAVFDDIAGRPIVADWVINQNPGAQDQFDYRSITTAKLLLGVKYVVLRHGLKGEMSTGGGGLLISMGGADRNNLGLKAVKSLLNKGADFPIRLICTASPSGYEAAVTLCKKYDHVQVSPPGKIEKYMLHADAALCAGGVTALELAHLGVASVITILADNQRPGALTLQKASAALVGDDLNLAVDRAFDLMHDADCRQNMSVRGRNLVDGKGAARIYQCLERGTRL